MRNNRLALYAPEDATDQLRASRGNSVEIPAREFLQEAGLSVVTAKPAAKDGRCDESIGAISIKARQGEDLANALTKAETGAKRQVTLSVAGLGWLDETEAVSVPEARPVTVDPETGEVVEEPRQRLARDCAGRGQLERPPGRGEAAGLRPGARPRPGRRHHPPGLPLCPRPGPRVPVRRHGRILRMLFALAWKTGTSAGVSVPGNLRQRLALFSRARCPGS